MLVKCGFNCKLALRTPGFWTRYKLSCLQVQKRRTMNCFSASQLCGLPPPFLVWAEILNLTDRFQVNLGLELGTVLSLR